MLVCFSYSLQQQAYSDSAEAGNNPAEADVKQRQVLRQEVIQGHEADVGNAQTVENSENSCQCQADAEGQLIVMDNHTTDVEDYQSDDNRIQHTDNGNGELDDVFQTKVCYYQAESRDEEYQSLVLYTIIAKLGEITGDSSCQTDAGGEAGEEDNQSQYNLTAEAHVIGADFAEQSCTVRDNTENVDAQCAGVSQCCIDNSEEEGCN